MTGQIDTQDTMYYEWMLRAGIDIILLYLEEEGVVLHSRVPTTVMSGGRGYRLGLSSCIHQLFIRDANEETVPSFCTLSRMLCPVR